MALVHACRWYQTVPNQPDLPYGLVTDALVDGGSQVSVTVLIQQAGASRLRIVKLQEQKLLGLVLYYCKKQKIPVPRQADKSFHVEGDDLVVTITRTVVSVAPP